MSTSLIFCLCVFTMHQTLPAKTTATITVYNSNLDYFLAVISTTLHLNLTKQSFNLVRRNSSNSTTL